MPPRHPTQEEGAMNGIPQLGDTVLNFVDGRWQAGTDDKWKERFDPADASVLAGRAPDSSREDTRQAIEAAHRAFDAWRAVPAPRRGKLLFDWLSWIDARKEHLAMLLTREEGKIIAESLG